VNVTRAGSPWRQGLPRPAPPSAGPNRAGPGQSGDRLRHLEV